MNKKPPELHLVDGTTPRRGMPSMLPEKIKKRIPQAEWLDNPAAWDKVKFIEETSNFLYEVYGIGNDQDKHTLGMLADHIDLYVKCTKGINKNGIVTTFNNGQTVGPNPYIGIRNKTMTLIIQLMNELGLTPRSRLSAGKIEEESPVAQFLKGPFAQ
jgi:P27 family predicted phage terminase small subunit